MTARAYANDRRVDELSDDLTIIDEPQLLKEIRTLAAARVLQRNTAAAQDTQWEEAQRDLVAVEMSEQDFEKEFRDPLQQAYIENVVFGPTTHRSRVQEEDDNNDERVKAPERKKRRCKSSRTSVCETL